MTKSPNYEIKSHNNEISHNHEKVKVITIKKWT